MNLSPANKHLFTVLFIWCFLKKIGAIKGVLLNDVINLKLFNNPPVCCCLTNGWFHVNEGQLCYPYSQILIKFYSNVPNHKKQKWAKFFHLILMVSEISDFEI